MDRPRVLIIDDDEDVIAMLQHELGRAGIRSDAAATAEDGLELMTRHMYPVVVLDIHMPGMNGVDTLSALKSRNSLVQTIMLTSDASMERVIECMDRGAVDFFSKTDTRFQVVEAVAAALGRAARWTSWIGTRSLPLSVSPATS